MESGFERDNELGGPLFQVEPFKSGKIAVDKHQGDNADSQNGRQTDGQAV